MRYQHLRLLLTPSLFGGVFAITAAVAFLGRSAWSYIKDGQLFYGDLFGAYGLHTYAWQNAPRLSGAERAALNSSLMYHVILIAGAVLVGAVVYAVLKVVSVVTQSAQQLLRNVEYNEPLKRKALVREIVVRLGLRAGVLVGWMAYLFVFFAWLLPACIMIMQHGIDYIQASRFAGWLLCLAAVLAAAVTVHLHIIFVRLYLLRMRVFS